MPCNLRLIVLTKTKTTIRYCELFRHGGKTLSTHVSNDLTQVSVSVEDESQQSVTFIHALRGFSTFVPTHAPSGPVLVYPLQCPTAKDKQPK
jgi:hypothetical protein